MPCLGFLGVIEVFALVTQPPGQLMHDFFEDHAVNILAQHVEEEPITHLKHTIFLNRMAPAGIILDYLALLNKGVDHFTFDQSESVRRYLLVLKVCVDKSFLPYIEQVSSHSGRYHYHWKNCSLNFVRKYAPVYHLIFI